MLPKSLINLSKYQQDYIDNFLNKDPVYPMVSKLIEKFLDDCVEKGSFYLRVQSKILDQIISSGRIKSCVEEGAGKGTTMGGPKARKILVEKLFGADLSILEDRDYPKFGYLSQSKSEIEPFVTYDLSYQYGNAIFKLKKKNLFNRTTLTVGDSVNFGRFNQMVATLVSDIKATCIMGPAHTAHPLNMRVNPPLANYQLLLRALFTQKLTTDNFYQIDEILGKIVPCFEFIELQYHGDIELARDVEEVIIAKDDFAEGTDMDSIKQSLEKIGVRLTVSDIFK